VDLGGAQAFRAGRHRVAAELRRAREAAALSTRELASRLGVSQPWITRIEMARNAASPEFARRWGLACGLDVSDAARLAEMAEHALDDITNWRRALAEIPEGLAGIQRQVAAIERTARVTRLYQPAIIPGLLQTADYMAHIFRGSEHRPAAVVSAAVAVRLERQAMLFDTSKRFYFLLGEAALWARPGTPEAHRAQLDRIRQVAGLEAVEVRVLPLTAAPPHWHIHGFAIFEEVARGAEPFVVVELLDSNYTPGGVDTIELYRATFEQLWAAAEADAEALAVIAKVERSLPL
jgi:transcriptional regulator with XRE-family HTH domain